LLWTGGAVFFIGPQNGKEKGMPRTIQCFADPILSDIKRQIESSNMSAPDKREARDFIDTIPVCGKGTVLRTEELKKAQRPKRKATEYNIFLGQCMRTGKKMKPCVEDWKQRPR